MFLSAFSALRLFTLIFAGFVVPTAAAADTWADAIAAVEARSEEIWELAQNRGLEGRFLGTVYNELDAMEHTCAILGRLLDRTEAVAELEASTEYDLIGVDGHSTGLAAHSLDNWVYNARRLLDVDRERRIAEWNLDCVGRMGIPASAHLSQNSKRTFYDVKGSTLRILGDIEEGFADNLRAALTENPQVRVVALGSGGGAVYEAMLAGLHIRSLGLETTLWNSCYSACTILFISGVDRKIWSPYPNLSFHQVSRGGLAVPNNDRVYFDLSEYAQSMGVLPKIFVGLMHLAPPSSFETPPSHLLCDLGLATWVQRICGF